jgi:hypothetical protein
MIRKVILLSRCQLAAAVITILKVDARAPPEKGSGPNLVGLGLEQRGFTVALAGEVSFEKARPLPISNPSHP